MKPFPPYPTFSTSKFQPTEAPNWSPIWEAQPNWAAAASINSSHAMPCSRIKSVVGSRYVEYVEYVEYKSLGYVEYVSTTQLPNNLWQKTLESGILGVENTPSTDMQKKQN